MAQTSFTVDTSALRKLFKQFTGPKAMEIAHKIASSKKTAAIITQAIKDNFEKEGPGWAPLKNSTIRASVSKTMRKHLISKKGKLFDGRTGEAPRQILRRTGVGYKSVTTPGAQGNVYRVKGTTIEWGTNLKYFGVHNRGATISHPGSKNAFGIKGLKTKAHKIVIPMRKYLYMSDYWRAKLNAEMAKDYMKALRQLWRLK